MSKVEVCVATVNSDKAIVQRMNLHSDACIANQTERDGFDCFSYKGNTIKMVSSRTKGVGINRNLSLIYASNDILMLADDDIVYYDDYCTKIEDAFEKNPKADVIVFCMEFLKNGKVYDVDRLKNKRLHFWNGLSFGAYQIAIRRDSLRKTNVRFSHLFGGGSLYCSGEDSLFLVDCLRKGMKVYSSSYLIGKNVRDSSSWFKGFDEKFYYDRGALIACAFPKLKFIVKMYYLFVYRKHKEVPLIKKIRLMNEGIKGFKKLKAYDE